MADRQTKFTLTEDARCYLRWLAKEVLLVKSGDEAAKVLVIRQIEEMRRAHRASEPPMEEMTRIVSNVPDDG